MVVQVLEVLVFWRDGCNSVLKGRVGRWIVDEKVLLSLLLLLAEEVTYWNCCWDLDEML